eukprot:TRINITY_DN26281_c0_g1_i2.p1 TRINITY_DN26281_c0_g1~~TRINITY_DN26281_c0_g1_i2.p1  ORF type:complete len:132 (+),score=6.25 TRINITY_DN26281_c0_g1_i2:179-574(+)
MCIRDRSRDLPGAVNTGIGPSPLRVGDSFEKMKAKMVPFERPPPVRSGVVGSASRRQSNPDLTPRSAAPAISTPGPSLQSHPNPNPNAGAQTPLPLNPMPTTVAGLIVRTPLGDQVQSGVIGEEFSAAMAQ